MDIVVWLRSLGLGKYEAVFRENDIDETVLPSLTHENLKELGVTAVGHRLKLLDAIAVKQNSINLSFWWLCFCLGFEMRPPLEQALTHETATRHAHPVVWRSNLLPTYSGGLRVCPGTSSWIA